MVSTTAVPRVRAATARCATPGGVAAPTANAMRKPIPPTTTPIINITIPWISVGNSLFIRPTKREATASQTPAKIVIPNINGKPPSLIARIDGPR